MKRIVSLLVVAVLALSVFTACGDSEKLGTGYCTYAKDRDVSTRDVSYVEICVEDYGKMIVLVDATTAPITVANFLKYVKEGYYDGLDFHRVVKDFMIQGGDGEQVPTIKGEFESNGHPNYIQHKRGVISMARTGEYDSATTQFFICNADSKFLDGNYAAFGYVIMGMSVVDKITENVFPKTAYSQYYGTMYHSLWSEYGNGMVVKDSDKPVIKYIKVLENYTPDFIYE
jgi:peptidyl-prolyl cis-trans isomerase B (cyclophilin B)